MASRQSESAEKPSQTNTGANLYIMLISVHGLVRGQNMELGRDADTGGQVLYVVELARALAAHPDVARVDLVTRQILDKKIDKQYAEAEEEIAPGAYITRIPCGPRKYLRKESLWPYLDSFVDNTVAHIARIKHIPNLIHSHYADAGYVGVRLASLLGVPLLHTGHSLGREKRRRLLDHGLSEAAINKEYNMSQRIEAEEAVMDHSAMVIASTHQEVEQQYSIYDNYDPRRMVVIPPGVDLSRFHPPGRNLPPPPIARELNRFFQDPKKPIILAMSRPDERKNISTLVEAYARHSQLRELANLAIVAGCREDIRRMEKGPREMLTKLLLQFDRHDLYGLVAYPKQHTSDDVPDLYRWVARSRGIFVNPALTEPFGLTLLEAAASGLPLVATNDGGPRDILGLCKNGLLVNPLDAGEMGDALLNALMNRRRWHRWAKNGLVGSVKHFSWDSHVRKYLEKITALSEKRATRRRFYPARSRMAEINRLIVCDVDNTLIGEEVSMRKLVKTISETSGVGLGVATGRSLESVREVLEEWEVPTPDVLITSVGTEIYYNRDLKKEHGWQKHINYHWEPEKIRIQLNEIPGLTLQPKTEQRRFKLSYFVEQESKLFPGLQEVKRILRQADLHANLISTYGAFLDVVPVRASKGQAIRYLGMRWMLPPERLLVAGDSGNDEEMLAGNTLGVVVGNYSLELEKLRDYPRIYFAEGEYAAGILEGVEYYDFLGDIRIPNEYV